MCRQDRGLSVHEVDIEQSQNNPTHPLLHGAKGRGEHSPPESPHPR